MDLSISFNSLQAGKSIQINSLHTTHNVLASNVSIPFKRESPSKLKPNSSLRKRNWYCFNSLQAGKSIQIFHRRQSFWSTG